MGTDVEIPGLAPPEEICGQRRLEFRVMPGTHVSLDQHAIVEFVVRLVASVQVFLLRNQNPSCHNLRIPLESTEFQPVSQLYLPRFAWSSDCASIRSRGCTAVLELLATPARAIIIAAD